MRRDLALVAASALLAGCGSCDRGADPGEKDDRASAPDASVSGGPALGGVRSSIDAVGLDACTLGHRGVLLDLGDRSTRAIYGTHLATRRAPETVEREGGTWARFRERAASLEFLALDGDLAPTASGGAEDEASFVEARVRGGVAKSISVYLNGKPIGALRLVKDESHVVSIRANGDPFVPGRNELLLRFNGVPRASQGDVAAEIDWIHFGRGEPTPSYAAPTRGDVTSNATLGGVSRRSLLLSAPGFARCSGWLPRGGAVELHGGIFGNGEADVEVSALVDRRGAVVSKTTHLSGNDWHRIAFPLDELGGAAADAQGVLGAVKVEVVRASPGVRVLIGDPSVVPPPSPPVTPAPSGRGAVVVVLGTVQPKSIAPYGGALAVPALTELASRGLVFESHRTSSTYPNGALAAILTGQDARSVNVGDDGARLPQGVTTLADAARQAGIATAMFTANPMTSSAFGFERAWGTFIAHEPTEDAEATRVFDDAIAWIEAHRADRFLIVIHARGGHPPWEVSADELKNLGPANYAGGIDPRHGAELLSKARHVPPSLRFGDADRARAWALYGHAVAAHDAALGRLTNALRAVGRDADTTTFVTADVSVNDTVHVPFGDGEPPEEPVLGVPLIVRPAGGLPEARRVATATGDVDLARSVLASLALPAPPSFRGIDLFRTASGELPPAGRPLFAATGARYALRLGYFVLAGSERREELCDIVIEPACIADVRATHPLATEALTRILFGKMNEDPADPRPPREPAVIDAATAAALKAWGR